MTALDIGYDAFEPETDMPLDKGIRRYVLTLRSVGIETFESCEGGEGHSSPEPMVRFHGDASEGFRAYAVAKQMGLPVLKFGMIYRIKEGWPMACQRPPNVGLTIRYCSLIELVSSRDGGYCCFFLYGARFLATGSGTSPVISSRLQT